MEGVFISFPNSVTSYSASLIAQKKFNNFVWKLSHQWLPTKQVFHSRGVTSDASCFRCGAQCEDVFHALWICPKINEVWRKYGFWKIIKNYQCPDIVAFLSKIIQFISLDDFEVFATTCWHMWQLRNKSLHGEKVFVCEKIPFSGDMLEWCYKFIDDYKRLNASIVAGKNELVKSKWKPPQHDCFKVNVDAFISKGDFGCSVAAVVIKEEGLVVGARSRYLKEGLLMVGDMKISNISVESDCVNAVSLLNKPYHGCSDFDGLVNKIRLLIPQVGFKGFNFVARSANGLAHCLAKIASLNRASAIWNMDIPSVARFAFVAYSLIPNFSFFS